MSFRIYKLDHTGVEQLTYEGRVRERGEDYVCIQATFKLQTRDLGYVTLKQGDCFTEWFYADRWYNVFKIEDVDTDKLKGYYCNITRPAIIGANSVRADDLALDIFVSPDGGMLLLDEDEYAALPLPAEDRRHVKQAITQIKALVSARAYPFEDIAPQD